MLFLVLLGLTCGGTQRRLARLGSGVTGDLRAVPICNGRSATRFIENCAADLWLSCVDERPEVVPHLYVWLHALALEVVGKANSMG